MAAIFQPESRKANAHFLAELYISMWDFDEQWYMANNQDIQAALPSETFPTAWHHFKATGYFEGRLPVEPRVDETWYLRTYPDVAAAILEGIFENGRQHFERNGYRRGRLPADPGVSPDWYAHRYLRGLAALHPDAEACTEHFIKRGYRSGAIPAPPI
jgi:hypothetical protein